MTGVDMRAAGALRILPPGLYARRGHVVLERAFRVYRSNWLVIFTGFFEPLFYLFALGTGLKHLVGTVVGPGGHPISYMAFIAPALLASSALMRPSRSSSSSSQRPSRGRSAGNAANCTMGKSPSQRIGTGNYGRCRRICRRNWPALRCLSPRR